MEILSQLFYIPPWLTLLSPFGDLLSSPRRRGPLPLHELPAAAFFCHPRAGGDRYPYTNCRQQRSSVIPAQAGTATYTRTAGSSVPLSSPRRRGPQPLHELPAAALFYHPRAGGDLYPYTNCRQQRSSVIPAQAGIASLKRTAAWNTY